MFIVVMGDLKRDTENDKQQVNNLLDVLKQQVSDLTIVSAACSKGIGSFVRSRCIQNVGNLEFRFIEYDVKIWGILGKAVMSKVYASRNPAIEAIGDVFHLFPFGGDVGHIADLINRVKASGLPLVIHHRTGRIEKINYTISDHLMKKTNETISSGDLKSQLE